MHPCEPIPVAGDLGCNVVVLPDGRLATLLGQPEPHEALTRERPARQAFLRYSADHGQTWGEPQPAFTFPAGPGVPMPLLLLVDQAGTLHAFSLQIYGLGKDGLPYHAALLHAAQAAATGAWSAVEPIDFGHQYTGSLNSAIVLKSGRIVVPLSYLDTSRSDGQFVSMTVYSDDGGRTWGQSNDCLINNGGAFIESGSIEPVVVQLRSGFVWMLIRTTTGYFWESFSRDGAVWTPPRQTRIVSSNAPGGLLRLADGRLLLAWNNLYGPPFHQGTISYDRHALHAAISLDDGQTWSPSKQVAQLNPGELHVTYPFFCQASEGTVLLLHHRIHLQQGRDWHHPIRNLLRLDPDWLLT